MDTGLCVVVTNTVVVLQDQGKVNKQLAPGLTLSTTSCSIILTPNLME